VYVCVCVCVCVCVFQCMDIHVYEYIYTYIYIYMCVCVSNAQLARVTTSRDDLMAHISSLFEARADRQAYEVKVRQLSANVDTLLQVNANAKDKNVSRSMTIQELREHTHVLERQVAEYKQRMESVIASHKECGGKIVAAQQSTRNVEQESARQKARADALTLESRKHSLRAAFLDQDLKKAKTAHTTLQTEHSELQRVHEAMAVENKTVSQSNMHLDLCVGELRKHKKTLNERVAGHVERETELEVLIKARDASIAGLGSQGALTQKSLDSTAQQLSTARQQLADQQTQHAEVVAKLKKMRGEFSITKKQLAATKTQLSEATLTANALQDAHQGCTAAIIKLENVRSAYEDTLPVTAALENEVKTLKDTLAEVVQANAGKVQDIHRQDGLLKQLRQDIHEMRMGKEAKEAAYEAMAIEFSKLNQDTDKLQKEEAQVW
jgi:chromosome segregation ATPase